MTEITHAQAVEIDTKLAELWQKRSVAVERLHSSKLSLAHDLGIRPHYVTKTRREVTESLQTLIDSAQAKLDNEDTPAWKKSEIERTLERVYGYQDEIKNLTSEAAPLSDLYDEHRWQRFFLVTNQNGHIHATMHCHSCNVRTQFAWLPELSGLTEKDAVEAHGPRLCTHCFPTAPVEWTIGVAKEEDPNQCPGSGTTKHNGDWRHRYANCDACGQSVSITSTGKLRKHKKENS